MELEAAGNSTGSRAISNVTLNADDYYMYYYYDSLSPTTFNLTANHSQHTSFSRTLMTWLNIIGNPLVILVGLFGNILCLIIFFNTHLRRQSTSIYLAYLCIVDSIFLLTLFINWLSWIDVYLINLNGWCQLSIYLSYVSCFLSAWTVVSFTVERWIVVFYPLRKAEWCTRQRTLIILGACTTVALLLYSFSFWAVGVVVDHGSGQSMCHPRSHYMGLFYVMTIVDSNMTFVLPFGAIAILNACIAYKIWFSATALAENRGGVNGTNSTFSAHADSTMHDASTTRHQNSEYYELAADYDFSRSATLVTKMSFDAQAMSNRSQIADENNECDDFDSVQTMDRCNSFTVEQKDNSKFKLFIEDYKEKENFRKVSTKSYSSRSSVSDNVQFMNKSQISSGQCNKKEMQQQRHQSKQLHQRKKLMSRIKSGNKSRQVQLKVTKVLLIISTSFLLLNFPSHVMRWHLFAVGDAGDDDWTALWQQVLQMLTYINFASNFFLYSTLSQSFRTAARLFFQRLRRSNSS